MFTGVEAEHSFFVAGEGLASTLPCVVGVCQGVLVFEDLDDVTAASPSVRRVVRVPERVVGRQGYSVEGGVLGPDSAVAVEPFVEGGFLKSDDLFRKSFLFFAVIVPYGIF